MNDVQLIGNVSRDPDIRFTGNGKAFCLFTVACNETYYDANKEKKQAATFVPCIAWGKLAEGIGESSIVKGTRVFVHGRISVRSYDDSNGVKKYITQVVADFVTDTVINGKGAHSGSPQTPKQAPDGKSFADMGDEIPPPPEDEELPF